MKFQKIFFLCFCLFITSFCQAEENPRLLIHIPTRSNPDQFIQTLNSYYEKLSKTVPYQFLISCDNDDLTMNCVKMKKLLTGYPNLTVVFGDNQSKIEGCNRDIQQFVGTFEIVFETSDHGVPKMGFDQMIVEAMKANFPNYDGVLNFSDGIHDQKINRMPVIGKNYYKVFGYIYQPAYHLSNFANQELSDISRMVAREAIIQKALVDYQNSLGNSGSRNQSFKNADQENYKQRFDNGFDLDEKFLRKFFTKDWSILICTLKERQQVFAKVYNKLNQQIRQNRLENKVEVLYFMDNREFSIGTKRNALMARSRGMYVNYIDDDDDVHKNYIKMIYEQLARKPDCISLVGIITFNGQAPKRFIHSIAYNTYFEKNNVYYRPPNHLNTMKRSIASRFLFPQKNRFEDTDWAMQIAKTGLLKKEALIQEPYYFYLYNDK